MDPLDRSFIQWDHPRLLPGGQPAQLFALLQIRRCWPGDLDLIDEICGISTDDRFKFPRLLILLGFHLIADKLHVMGLLLIFGF